MSDQEKTPDGNPVYRYENHKPKDFQPAIGDESNIEAISNHIEKHIGKIESVYHEIVSDLVHIDIHWVKPSADFPFHTLVTSGMSDKPMSVPEGLEEHRYAELCVLLPADWKMREEDFKDEKNYWPLRWLKIIARFPHEFDTWVGWGHTIPNGENAEPFADNTKLGCMMLHPAISLPEEFFQLIINEQKTIRFYCLLPLYKEEMELKLKKGSDAVTAKFEEFGVRDVVDVARRNTCKKKGLFGWW